MSCGLAKDLGMLMVLRWYDLVPSVNCFVGCLFSQLLCYGGFGRAFRFNDTNVQFVSVVHEWWPSCFSPSTRDFQWRHWFPRCCSSGADGYRCRECPISPIGLNIGGSKPRIPQDEIVGTHVRDVESESVGFVACEYFQLREVR